MNNFLQGLMNYHFVQNALISSVLIGADCRNDWMFYHSSWKCR